jgi:acetyltransferase-like isoleucine patch superfamily enzyme
MFRGLPKFLLIKIKAASVKRKISNKDAQVNLNNPFFKIKVIKEKGAKFIVKGKLTLCTHFGENTPVYINLYENSTLEIDGDFSIGNGVQIHVDKNGLLRIGGKAFERESGITRNSKIYAYKHIEIGKDFLCGWDNFITDCDWHYVESDKLSKPQSDVIIGDHVWITNDCSILKWTQIGHDSIVGCKSLLSGKLYPSNSLIGGIPAKVIEGNYKWKFDLPENNS